jgi:hypothetical protein
MKKTVVVYPSEVLDNVLDTFIPSEKFLISEAMETQEHAFFRRVPGHPGVEVSADLVDSRGIYQGPALKA